MDHKYKKYLIETTISANYPDTGGIASDDDMPPGNINFGPRYVRKDYSNRLTGMKTIWDIDDNDNSYLWDFFAHSSGMEDPDNYHPTLKGLEGVFGDRLKKRIRRTEVPDAEVRRANIKNRRPEMNPKHAIGNDPVPSKDITDPEDVISKIEKITK